jgi:hypothetical protein
MASWQRMTLSITEEQWCVFMRDMWNVLRTNKVSFKSMVVLASTLLAKKLSPPLRSVSVPVS